MPSIEEVRALIGAKEPPPIWTPKDGLIAVPWGPEGCGKTRFALTFPGPLVIHDLEGNVEETMSTMPGIRENVAAYYKYSVPILADKNASKPIWEEFKKNFHGAVEKFRKAGVTGTHIVDSGTRVWELIRYAVVPLDDDGRVRSAWYYAPGNDAYAAMFYKCRDYKQNLVVPCRASNVWEKTASDSGKDKMEKTSRLEADWKDPTTAYLASVIVELSTKLVRGKDGKVDNARVYKVKKCTPNEALKKEEFDMLDYDTLIAAIESYE